MDTSLYKSDFVKVNDVRLHYLDWGGNGPVLLFLAGLSRSAYIFAHFAPRFTDKFHVLALTRRGHGDSDYPETGYDPNTLTNDVRQFMDALKIDRAILVGHSMASVELCRFSALYPERVLKLVFLDAAYDLTSPAYKAMMEKHPLRDVQLPGLNDDYYTVEDCTAAIKRALPSLAAIWGELMDEEFRHVVMKNPEGKVVDRMSATIDKALHDTLASYKSEFLCIQAPVLSIYVVSVANIYISDEWMTEEQKALLVEYFDLVRPPLQRECINQFRRDVPHARIVEIPKGHHYCFIKQEEIVFNEMRAFLLE